MKAEAGVYKITNTITGDFYIGGSKDITARIKTHKRMLVNGTHYNQPLLNSWNKYGASSFSFDVLETCEESCYLKLEQQYLDKYFDHALNINLAKDSTAPMLHRRHTEEAIRKIKKATKGRKLTQEHKDNIAKAHRGMKRTGVALQNIINSRTNQQGSNNHNAKLTPDDVMTIRARLTEGSTLAQVASDFGVGVSTIHDIKTGKRWSNVK